MFPSAIPASRVAPFRDGRGRRPFVGGTNPARVFVDLHYAYLAPIFEAAVLSSARRDVRRDWALAPSVRMITEGGMLAGGMSYYAILRGPLGVGKTTISAAVSHSIAGVVVSIDEIADQEWDGGSLRLFLRANKVAAAATRKELARGVPVVMDGCFYWKTQIRDLERRLPFPHEVFTLRAPLSVCIERDSGRKVAFGAEAAEQVYRKVTRIDYGIPIDATQDVSRIAEQIRSQLPHG